ARSSPTRCRSPSAPCAWSRNRSCVTVVPDTGTPVTTPRWWSSPEGRPEEVTEPAAAAPGPPSAEGAPPPAGTSRRGGRPRRPGGALSRSHDRERAPLAFWTELAGRILEPVVYG